MVNLANGLGEEFGALITERFPQVAITNVAQSEPWKIPAGTEVAFVGPGPGWRNPPKDLPDHWGALKWVQAVSAGVDLFPSWLLSVPLVTCGRGLTAEPIAEYVICAMLNHEKNFLTARVRRAEDWGIPSMGTLHGRKLGLVGYGALGKAIARLAKAFGMEIVVLKRSGGETSADFTAATDIKSLVATVDHLVLAAPLTDKTRGMINADVLNHAKKGLHLINIARGAQIVIEDLYAALDASQLSGATLDVTSPEPPVPGDPIYSHPKIFLTPHCSWRGREDLQVRQDEQMLDNIRRYLATEPLNDIIDAVRGY
ncbi:NAD(P)-dependent oxidoreductase [Neorhizobium sp. DAR64861/K0K2]|uniref:NAD(P)-dependent oxidoreductase n=1 Tax=Neorhizobium sp. DAR64861/K0K2 TaxID=3421956 RepID=UPI003D2E0636